MIFNFGKLLKMFFKSKICFWYQFELASKQKQIFDLKNIFNNFPKLHIIQFQRILKTVFLVGLRIPVKMAPTGKSKKNMLILIFKFDELAVNLKCACQNGTEIGTRRKKACFCLFSIFTIFRRFPSRFWMFQYLVRIS